MEILSMSFTPDPFPPGFPQGGKDALPRAGEQQTEGSNGLTLSKQAASCLWFYQSPG